MLFQESSALDRKISDKFEKLLSDEKFLPNGGRLAFPAFHLYSNESAFNKSELKPLDKNTVKLLKGADHYVSYLSLNRLIIFPDCSGWFRSRA